MNNGKTVEYGKEPYAPGSFTRAVRFNREKVTTDSIIFLYLARNDGNDRTDRFQGGSWDIQT